jgi:hypothetical protein
MTKLLGTPEQVNLHEPNAQPVVTSQYDALRICLSGKRWGAVKEVRNLLCDHDKSTPRHQARGRVRDRRLAVIIARGASKTFELIFLQMHLVAV